MFILDMSLNIANFKLQPHIPVGKELNQLPQYLLAWVHHQENTEIQKSGVMNSS